jgi:peptidoglycan/LPS O-acetylase OafA/YrhL
MATRQSEIASSGFAPPPPSPGAGGGTFIPVSGGGTSIPVSGGGGAVRLDWLDPIKAFALIAILLNHLVEEFGPGPWYTNPGTDWPGGSFASRLPLAVPHGGPLAWSALRFLGWLGDSGPGVFIFASGLGLTLAALRQPRGAASFYKRRLLRLYPLYIAMHVVILGLALIVPHTTVTFGTPATLLSVAGLRFTRGLFFYISPSWWFVWLILQLYAVYPLLIAALERVGPRTFFAGAVVLTIASRAVGLALPVEYHYDWLTGLFFGSRLAEFAAGMVAAAYLTKNAAPPASRVAGWSAVLYIAGLLASFTIPGALVSNLLITLGLVGLFYAAWQLIRHSALATPVTALGVASYGVFLLHQAPLKWTANLFATRPPLHMAAALAVIAISIPAARLLERAVDAIRLDAPSLMRRYSALISWLGGLLIVAALIVVTPTIAPDSRSGRALAWILAVTTGLLAWLDSLDHDAPFARRLIRRVGWVSGLLGVFLAPPELAYVAPIVGLVAGLFTTYTGLILGTAVTIAVLGTAELAFGRLAPREVNGWGERPALMTHPTRAFGLIPSRTTHLRYNDYDYVIRTNALGLASPEIPVARPTPTTFRVLTMGDAFTMPEGLPYEQSYPALLQDALTKCMAPRSVQVINAGVTGYGPLEELPQLNELAPQFHPDVIVHEFFVNDWQDITIQADQRRRGIGLVGRVPMSDRSEMIANFRRWYESAKATITGHPSPDQNWKLMLPYFHLGPNALYDTANVERMATFVAGMHDAADSAHASLLFIYVPAGVAVLPRADIEYLPKSGIPLSDPTHYDLRRPYTPLAHITDSLGVPLLDLTGPLSTHQPQPTYYRNAWHWTPEGHRAAASAILSNLAARGLIPASCTQ